MSSLKVLHLSDFHFGNFRYDEPTNLAVKISDTLYDQSKKVDVIVVSGDLFDGRSQTIEDDRIFAIAFFDTLITQLRSKSIVMETFDREDILFVPGNHDLLREKGREFEKYDMFQNLFYPQGRKKYVQFVDKYNFYYRHPDKNVIILGFNSCKIEVEKIKEEELRWIDKIDLSPFSDSEKIKETIKSHKISEKENWDDYGYLDPLEVDNLFIKLKTEVNNLNEFTIVGVLHHHFYPFPEIINKLGDTSLIRNYPVVVDKFQREKVSIVLHGHKHLPIQRVVTDNKYFDNPDSVIYVLAAGSVGCKQIYNPSFQWLRIFGKNESKIADGERYDFNDEELNNIKAFSLPPQKKDEQSVVVRLIEILQNEDSTLYKKYISITDEFEQVIQDNGIEKVIETISSLITMFKDINQELQRDPKLIFSILLAINYRIIFLNKIREVQNVEKLEELLIKIRNAYKEAFPNSEYANNLISFLSAHKNTELDACYEQIIKNVKSSEKRYSAYVSICLFFTDLFLNISKYGEYYFEKEGLKHKININLERGLFYNNIPNQSISIVGNIDRRAIIFNFKCKNPTVHKIAVLIVKDFEMRLSKFEESLREINLKLYYIIPRVTPDKYDLENFHFDAYIPTLLPLLTGDNLYQQKEVFIRELVQNSIDAVLLRKKINPEQDFETDIVIEFGVMKKNSKPTKYFKIVDQGIGMSKFTIERYFTSIGRSFYVSEEFDELKKNKNIKYQAISNFGIGFLSSFMVCKEILVRTKSVLEGGSLEIEIPNYDGCFFIRNTEKEFFGTEVTLFADERNLFDFKKFSTYIRDTFLNLEIRIKIIDNTPNADSFEIDPYLNQRLLSDTLKQDKDLMFFVPFTEEGIKQISWYNDFYLTNEAEKYKYGLYVNFSHLFENFNNATTTLNQGLKISKPFLPFKLKDTDFFPRTVVNYPSSFIQLDVAREKVNAFKRDKDFGSDILRSIQSQVEELLNTNSDILSNSVPLRVNQIGYFLKQIRLDVSDKFYSLKLKITKQKKLKISLVRNDQIPASYNSKVECYFNTFNSKDILGLITFVLTNNASSVLYSKIDSEKLKAYESKFILNPIRMDVLERTRYIIRTSLEDYRISDISNINLNLNLFGEDKLKSIPEATERYLAELSFRVSEQFSNLMNRNYIVEREENEPSNSLFNYYYLKSIERYPRSNKKANYANTKQGAFQDGVLNCLMNLSFFILSSFSINQLEKREFTVDF